jgi:hypothetical protein
MKASLDARRISCLPPMLAFGLPKASPVGRRVSEVIVPLPKIVPKKQKA